MNCRPAIPLVLGAVLTVSCAHRMSNELPSTRADAADVRQRLKEIEIKNVQMEKVQFLQALVYLGDEISRSAPEFFKENSLMQKTGESYIRCKSSSAPKAGLVYPRSRRRVSVKRDSMTALQLLNWICGQSGLVWRIEDNRIVTGIPREFR